MDNEKSSRDPTQIITLDDTQHVAFLKLKGYTVKPWIETDDQIPNQDPNTKRVEFQVEGDPDSIEKDMQGFYQNELVGVQDFCRELKSVKSSMYNLRRMKRI